MDKILIGLVAPKQSGKDTIADYLCMKYSFKKYNFADPLKEGIGKIFGFTNEQLYGDDKEVIDPFWGVSPREVLQKVGTELFQYELPRVMDEFKDMGRTFWVKCFERWYINELNNFNSKKLKWSDFVTKNKDLSPSHLDSKKPYSKVVISDIRFLHEALKVKEFNGILIKVNRDVDTDHYSNHLSETEYLKINCDYVIENKQDKEHLFNEIDTLMTSISELQHI